MGRALFAGSSARVHALIHVAILVLVLAAPSCALAQDMHSPEAEAAKDRTCAQAQTHELLDATLWTQTSAEYQMATSQAYLLASIMVDRALSKPDWTAAPEQITVAGYQKLPPAVIFDVDETLLSNVRFEGRIITDFGTFDPTLWATWQKTGSPGVIEGALAFVERLQELGVNVFYVTNRDRDYDAETAASLRAWGFPVTTGGDGTLLSKHKPEWGSNKTTRRAYLAQRYRILLLVGDDLNDFVAGARKDGPGPEVTPQSRRDLAARYRDYWGTKWIVIPNPMYGSWERALYGFDDDATRCAIVQKKRGDVTTFP